MAESPRMPPSKFGPRPLGPYALERRRLLALLERHADAKLVLIHAPAGYGKSTLMTQWYQHLSATAERIGTGWLWIDGDDNDPGRFSAALSQVLLPQAVGDTDLLDCINGSLQPHGRFTLFLDEEEHLVAEDAIALLDLLLDLSPSTFQLVVGSRAQPRRLGARLRMRSDFLELSARDLAFGEDEIAQFVRLRCGDVTLDSPTLAHLTQRTEGWAAALQLAAVEIARGELPQAVCERLARPHSNLLHYLSDEILVHLQPRQREFLLQTSFLLELSGPLCDAVTGGTDGEALLLQLQQANLLLQPIDEQHRRYRYHALFADLLVQQMRQQDADRLAMLARRASDWCAHMQRAEETVEYALLAGDTTHLVGCMRTCMDSLIHRARFETAKRWLHAVPAAQLNASADLLVWSAWVALWTNDFAAAREAVSELEQLSRQHPFAVEQRLGADIVRVLLRVLDGRYQEALAITEADARQLQPRERGVIVRLCNLRALLAQMQARFGEAAAQSEQATVLAAQDPPMWLSLLHAAHIRGMTEISLGNLSSAWREFHRPERMLAAQRDHASSGVNPGQLLALLCGSRALVLYERNRLEDAEDCLQRYAPFMNTVFSPTSRLLWFQLRSRLCALHGDEEGCLATQEEGAAYAIRHGIGWMQLLMQWERIDYDVARGDLDHARSLAAGLPHQAPDAPAEWIVSCEELFGPVIGSHRLLIHNGQGRVALESLRAHIAQSERQLRRLRLTKLRVLESLALQAEGEQPRALDSLRQALELGQRSGAIRTFLDEGTRCRELLVQLLRVSQAYPAHAERVLAAFDGTQGAATPAAPSNPEPLSVREQQILQCLARGHSNLAVGQQLALSANTVKWHLRQIYGKLGVRSRTHAVHIALQQRWLRHP